jgi:hypothetical protein
MRPDITYDVPSTAGTVGMFFFDIFLYSILAWYFDHIDSSNRGKSYGYFFFLDKNYWFNSKANHTYKKVEEREINQLTNEIGMTEQKLLDKDNKNKNQSNKSSLNNSCKIMFLIKIFIYKSLLSLIF